MDPWIPVTPANPELKTRQPSSQWLSPGAPAKETAVGHVTDLGSLGAAMAAQNDGAGNVGAIRNAAAMWRKIPHTQRLAFANALGATVMEGGVSSPRLQGSNVFVRSDRDDWNRPLDPAASFSSINGGFEQVGTLLGCNDRSYCSPHVSQDGIPVTYGATYHHMPSDVIANGTKSFCSEPKTPDLVRRVQLCQAVETNGYSAMEKVDHVMEKVDIGTPIIAVSAGLRSTQGDLQPIYQGSPAVPSTPFKETDIACARESLLGNFSRDMVSAAARESQNQNQQGIDLNKTPRQKPKRKKHRPKVITEDKPKRTPKPVTPNQTTEKENPVRKRKYVRRAGIRTSASTMEAKETVESNDGVNVRSCKRQLNFDLESNGEHGRCNTVHVQEETSSAGWSDGFGVSSGARTLNLDTDTLCCDPHERNDFYLGSKSVLQANQGLKVVESNSSVGFAFDFNSSLVQSSNRTSLPGNANYHIPSASKEPSMLHMNGLPTMPNLGLTCPCINVHQTGYTQMHQNIYVSKFGCRVRPTIVANEIHHRLEPFRLQNSILSSEKTKCGSNSISHFLLNESNPTEKGTKREHSLTLNECAMDLYAPPLHASLMEACQSIVLQNGCNGNGGFPKTQFLDSYKRMRVDMLNKELTSNMPESLIAHDGSARQAVANTGSSINNDLLTLQATYGRTFPLCSLVMGNQKTQNGYAVYGRKFQSMAGKHYEELLNKEEFSCSSGQRGFELNKLQTPVGIHNVPSTIEVSLDRPVLGHKIASVTAATIACDSPLANSVKVALTYNSRQVGNVLSNPQACMKTAGRDNYGKIIAGESSRRPCDLAYTISPRTNQVLYPQEHNSSLYLCHQSCVEPRVATPAKKPIGTTVSSSRDSQQRSSQTASTNYINFCQSSNNGQQMWSASNPSQVRAPQADPMDVIVQKLQNLSINNCNGIATNQAQYALVPYSQDQKVVTFEGPFDLAKKRHPRPKVDLDPETDRVWKLLMWKEVSDGKYGVDVKKEKWWEEERRVFRGRADSFIARMRLVQGDRRFSPWKGSVVDSVVGVFLTQNVSDQLSSSAFMALAARFPLRQRSSMQNGEGKGTSAQEHDGPIQGSDDSKEHSKIWSHECDEGSVSKQEVNSLKEMENAEFNNSLQKNMGACRVHYTTDKKFTSCQFQSEICQEPSKDKVYTALSMTKNAHLVGIENIKATEVASPQESVLSSQNSTESIVQVARLRSECNSEADYSVNHFEGCDFRGFASFIDLQQMAVKQMFSEFHEFENKSIPSTIDFSSLQENQLKGSNHCVRLSGDRLECSKGLNPSNSTTSTNQFQAQQQFEYMLDVHSNGYHLNSGPGSGSVDLKSMEASVESKFYFSAAASEIPRFNDTCSSGETVNTAAEKAFDNEVPKEISLNVQTSNKEDSCVPVCNNTPPASVATPHTDIGVAECSTLSDENTTKMGNLADQNLKNEVRSSVNASNVTGENDPKGRRPSRADKKSAFDWDILRKQACSRKERSSNTMDSVDWEAVRCADVKEISNAIRERGMNNKLSERIKDFLNRLVRDHGSIDLEWLRDVPPGKAKDYLLSIRGLGLKSVECVRLLTLHHLAFPVDTNVGRICVRLGWVPLQPLPESIQLHLLELYPLLETIQMYLWPRLCTLDQRTLYELHYQMITFGKVFCTKSKPNCNACPMRGECKHFASAFASARLALPGPEEKQVVSLVIPQSTEQDCSPNICVMPLPPVEENMESQPGSRIIQCEPIIEEPVTPEPECIDTSENAIEDAFWTDDPDEIPTIKLNIEEFTQNVQSFMQENAELQSVDMSMSLVALTQEAASIPMPKLKNISRLRTEHQVYELPDLHPLLVQMERREPDDPCPYLLAIWTPGETAQSVEPPETCCSSQKSGHLCSKKTCFTCNSIREADAQTVRGTLLIPCRTAMRGSFPLNGTYFQVNEVFADHDSSLQPLNIPRAWIWNLSRRTVYFGTSVSTIFKGLTTEGIQQCFWKGFVCVRGFDQKTRAPRPLIARLHFPASKLAGIKKAAAESK